MVSNRHSVHKFKGLAVELKIDIAVSRGIHDAPELAFPWSNGNTRADGAVQGEDFLGRFGFVATAAGRRFHLSQQGRRLRILRDGLPAYDQYLFVKIANFRDVAFHAVDYDCTGHSIAHLAMALAVGVSVIPEQARRMIPRDSNGVAQRLARHRHHRENIVLRRVWRNFEAVKMKVGHVHAWRNGT